MERQGGGLAGVGRTWMIVVILAAFAVVAVAVEISVQQIFHPVDLLFESQNQTIISLMKKGDSVYSRKVFDAPPFALNLYPPLYFRLVSAISPEGPPRFWVGRSVSLFFLIASLGLFGFFARSTLRIAWMMVGVAWVLCFPPVILNGAFVRMETMALFFSAAAVAVISCNAICLPSVAGSAILSYAALMTKQSYVAGPACCALFLIWRHRKWAWMYLLILGGLLGISIAILESTSGGGYVWCVLKAARQPFSLDSFLYQWEQMEGLVFYALLGLSVGVLFHFIRQDAFVADSFPLPVVLYFSISWLWLLCSLSRLGASTNYFIEPIYTSVAVVLCWAGGQNGGWQDSRICRVGLVGLSVLFLWQAAALRSDPLLRGSREDSIQRTDRLRMDLRRMALPPQPRILDFSIYRYSLNLGCEQYLNDPFLYRLLWNRGVLSNRSLLDAIDTRMFDVIMLEPTARPEIILSPTPLGEIYMKIYERYDFLGAGLLAYYAPQKK